MINYSDFVIARSHRAIVIILVLAHSGLMTPERAEQTAGLV